jgi:hypothetical protein
LRPELSLSAGEAPLAVDDLDSLSMLFKVCVLSDDWSVSSVSTEAELDTVLTVDDVTSVLLTDSTTGCCAGGGETARATGATASVGNSFFCCGIGCEMNCCPFAGTREVATLWEAVCSNIRRWSTSIWSRGDWKAVELPASLLSVGPLAQLRCAEAADEDIEALGDGLVKASSRDDPTCETARRPSPADATGRFGRPSSTPGVARNTVERLSAAEADGVVGRELPNGMRAMRRRPTE